MTTKTITGRKKADLTIRFNGQDINLGQVLLSTAQKKAHHMIRDFLKKEWRQNEAVAKIETENVCVSEIYGFRKCSRAAINIIHA